MSKETKEAKSAIFDSIRQNLAVSAPFDAVYQEHQAHKVNSVKAGTDARVSAVDLQEIPLIERFRENLISIGGNCETVKGKFEAALLVKAIIEKCGARRIAVTDSNLIGELTDVLETDAEILQSASKESLFECDLGITGAQFGIAETGTLCLESEKEFSRLASLVPPVHVCLLPTEQIRQTLGEVLEVLKKDLSRTVTFITGPSRTSDIELTLAIGVHGPGQLFVILIGEK